MVEHSSFDKLVGTILGNYRLERLIEQNELGATFLAKGRNTSGNSHDGTKNTTCLLRILAVPTDLTPEARIVYLGRFQKEANQVAELQNPYILPLLDYGNRQGIPYLVSPNLPLTSLSTLLTQKGPLDVLITSRYLDQIATALEYAHEHAMLHRNLTADCIFFKPDGKLVVVGFGVMRMLELSRSDTALYGNSGASAPAPEQLLGEPADTYTDVYALGAVLYRMLTAHRVFRGKNRAEIVEQHLHAPVPSVSKWRSGLPTKIDGVIANAMAKEPAQRFRQPGALADAYHQIVAPNDSARKPFAISAPSPTKQSGEDDHDKPSQGQRVMVGAGLAPALENPARIAPALQTPAYGRDSSRPARAASAQRSPAQRISRRRALTIIGVGGGSAVAIAAVAVFASHYLVGTTSPTGAINQAPTGSTQTNNPPTQGNNPPAQGGHVLARTSDIPLNGARTFPIANSPNPLVLIHLSNNQFVAFNSTCTHAGCAVNYNPQDKLLECPCHGAVFDPAKGAAVVAGPAPTPLAKIPITVNPNGTITQP